MNLEMFTFGMSPEKFSFILSIIVALIWTGGAVFGYYLEAKGKLEKNPNDGLYATPRFFLTFAIIYWAIVIYKIILMVG